MGGLSATNNTHEDDQIRAFLKRCLSNRLHLNFKVLNGYGNLYIKLKTNAVRLCKFLAKRESEIGGNVPEGPSGKIIFENPREFPRAIPLIFKNYFPCRKVGNVPTDL